MKKIAIRCLQLLTMVGITSLTNCGTSDTVTPAAPSTITVQADPTANYVLGAGATNLKFEKGEKIKIKVKASVPGGIQIFTIRRKVGTTPIPAPNELGLDVTTAYTSQGLPGAGATSYEKTFEITVAETFNATAAENKVVFTFEIKNSQATTFTRGTFTYEVVAQGQGGGGGLAPLLRTSVTVGLGSQSATQGSYYASSVASINGVYTSMQATALPAAAKQLVDITFGVGDATGTAQLLAAATHNILLSPDERANQGFNGVPLGTDARATTFKTSALTTLSAVTSTTVNDLDHSTGTTKFVAFINTGTPVFSFKNFQGAKGFIRIASVTGTGDMRVANIEVLVQQLQ